MKICTVDGCGRPHRARELCSTHYNQLQKNRHPAKVMVECARCGTPCLKAPHSSRPRRFCSLKCRTDDQYEASRSAKLPMHVGPSWPRTEIPLKHPCRRPKPPRPEWWTVLVAGGCNWCGTYFVGCGSDLARAPRYCSPRCQRYANRRRFTIRPAERIAIYERDGWICQLCSGPVDPDLDQSDQWGATLDHVECQSWGTPDHSAENLRLAHRWCNSVRGDERYYTADVLAA